MHLIVPVAGEDQGPDFLDAAAEQSENVERGLIRPMDVFEHEERRCPLTELCDQCRRDLMRFGGTRHEVLELASGHVSDLEKRCERTRCQERITCAPKNVCPPTALIAKPLQEDRLSSPCLATDEHQPSFGTGEDGGETVVKDGKMIGSLD
jgi:hypothetical protein